MKKTIPILLIVCLLLGIGVAEFALHGSGRVRDAVVTADETDLFTNAEIRAAVRAVKNAFRRSFTGTLLTVEFLDDEQTRRLMKDFAAHYGADEAIVLYSDFRTGEKYVNGGLEPDHLYSRWNWVLTRSGSGRWKIRTWGY